MALLRGFDRQVHGRRVGMVKTYLKNVTIRIIKNKYKKVTFHFSPDQWNSENATNHNFNQEF